MYLAWCGASVVRSVRAWCERGASREVLESTSLWYKFSNSNIGFVPRNWYGTDEHTDSGPRLLSAPEAKNLLCSPNASTPET